MYAESDLLPLSALRSYQFCPRQCALIHLEEIWEENRLTAEGRLLHEKADTNTRERRGEVLIVRGLWLRSLELGLAGRADVVEFHGNVPLPVEYKRGRPKQGMEDKVQLCAQAMCLEEMTGRAVPDGALFYGSQNRRLDVPLNDALRELTRGTALSVHALVEKGVTPPAKYSPACRNCSLVHLCMPAETSRRAANYLERLRNEP